MISYFEPNFIEKFLWESGFSNFGQIKMSGNENRLFGRHFETVHIFYIFFSGNMVVISVYTYGVKII